MQNQKGISTLIGIVIVVAVAVVLFGGFFCYQYITQPKESNQSQDQQTACTLEAKVCPDGSAVGRIGPNCEFAECPVVPNQTVDMTVQFICDNNKSITANYYDSRNDIRHVNLKLSDGRELSLPSVTSASGDKYANTNESIIFWSKGVAMEGEGTAFIFEKTVQTYANCIAFKDQTAGWKTYTNTQYGFEVKYPTDSELKIYEKQPFSIEIYKYVNANERCQVRGSTFDKRASFDGTPQNFNTTPNDIKRVIRDGGVVYTIDTITADPNIGLVFDVALNKIYMTTTGKYVYDSRCNNFLDEIMQTVKFTK